MKEPTSESNLKAVEPKKNKIDNKLIAKKDFKLSKPRYVLKVTKGMNCSHLKAHEKELLRSKGVL